LCAMMVAYGTEIFRNRLSSNFFQSAYEAGAMLGQWDRETLERER
jgi:hypothetical protein